MNWQNTLYSLPGIIIGLTVHEYCHARAAYALGDTTAKDQGRLTLNPLRHIDIIGFIFILVAGFGWAKPVRFSPGALNHPRRDKALIAAAGPLSNLVIALILLLALRFIFPHIFTVNSRPLAVLFIIIYYAAAINLGLFLFNLIPIPPLDGSHIVFSGLNLAPETEYRIMRIGAPALFIILIVQNRIGITILPIGKIIQAIMSVFL
ncbi:metalloprotease [Spirochaetia bacterium]|nr:metalloprotease [Spirochaetia bacterium]